MPGKIVTLSPKAIIVSGLQIREEMDRKHADELAELFDEDNPTWPDGLPPVVVFHDGKSYFLADGHHRLEAAVQSGCTEIRVEVHKGTMEDALRHACGANASHGLKRTNADKRNAVRIAYQLNPGNTARATARLCRVSHDFANNVIHEIKNDKPRTPKNNPPQSSELSLNDNKDNSGGESSEAESNATNGGGGLSIDESEDGRNEGESDPAAPQQTDWRFSHDRDFDRANQLLCELAQAINRIGHLSGGEMLRSHYLKLKSETRCGATIERLYSPDLENLRRELKHWRPHSPICPVCNGTPSQHCNLCFGLPYLTRGAYERLTDEQRAKLEKGPTNDAA